MGLAGAAAIVSAVAAAAGTTYGVVSGERSNRVQKRALARQEQANSDATAQAQSDSQAARARQRAAGDQPADVTDQLAGMSLGSTQLAGPGGVDVSKLKFRSNSLLGG